MTQLILSSNHKTIWYIFTDFEDIWVENEQLICIFSPFFSLSNMWSIFSAHQINCNLAAENTFSDAQGHKIQMKNRFKPNSFLKIQVFFDSQKESLH